MRSVQVFVFLAALSLLPAVAVAQSSGASVQVKVLKYDPSPAEAGKFVDVWLSVRAVGNVALRDYVVEVLPDFPFFLAAGEDSVRKFPVIDSNGVVARFKVRVDESAPNQDSDLKIAYYPVGSATKSVRDVKLSVLGKADVEIFSAEPDTLLPGKPTKVKFWVKNTGSAPIRDLVVSWSDPDGDILPLADENRHKIGEIGVGESQYVEFNMIADPSASQGVNLIDVTLEFLRFGNSSKRSSEIAFIVGGLTNFEVAQESVGQGTLSLSVANVGVNSATGVILSVPDQDGWRVTGASDSFLGNLEPGDFTVASVEAVPLLQGERQTLKVSVHYTDTVGIRQSVEKGVVMRLDNLISQPKKDDSGAFYIVLVLALAAAVVAHFKFNAFKLKRR